MLDTERSTRHVRVEVRCWTFMLDSKLRARPCQDGLSHQGQQASGADRSHCCTTFPTFLSKSVNTILADCRRRRSVAASLAIASAG